MDNTFKAGTNKKERRGRRSTWLALGVIAALAVLTGGVVGVGAIFFGAFEREPAPAMPSAPVVSPAPVASPELVVPSKASVVSEPPLPESNEPPEPEPPILEPPPPRVATAKALDHGEISTGLRALSGKVRRCYEGDSSAPPTVAVRVQVEPGGEARYLGADPEPTATVAACVQRALARAGFRATGARSETISYSFDTGGGAKRRTPPVPHERQQKRRLKTNPFR